MDRPCLNSQLRVLGTNCQEIYVSSQHLHSLRVKHLLTWRTWTAPITFVQVKRRFYSIILKKILLFNCKLHAFYFLSTFMYFFIGIRLIPVNHYWFTDRSLIRINKVIIIIIIVIIIKLRILLQSWLPSCFLFSYSSQVP